MVPYVVFELRWCGWGVDMGIAPGYGGVGWCHVCVGVGGFDTNCTAVCILCDSSTTCRLCRLEQQHIASLVYPIWHVVAVYVVEG